jgi:tetratricopeptide (TPR) repeat protein/transcriptional regulator with XRE-family HTH domain
VADPPVTFGGALRRLRTAVGLTQEELAEAASVSLRSVSDLERGRVTIPHKDTVRLLADALRLAGPARAQFEALARGRAVAGGSAAARTLPHDIASFTGRQRELQELVCAAADAGRVVSIHAIGGMAGIGKTALAVHAAHRLADRFPAGQIFLPLHGHTPGQQPVDPMDALASLLLTTGVAAAAIPPGLEARMALWRDRLAGQQLLLILDDAIGSEQVLPLLPGTGGNMVLITSRRHLSALDATAISLDMLPSEEAAGLLIRLAGRPGLSQADPGVREIIRLCGFLPLAIGMVGRQLHHHLAWSASSRAAELAAARDRLELMATENVSVAAAFDLSYAHLATDHQRLFRRLGLHPGAEFDRYAAAALDDADLAAARRGLEALYDQYLLTEPAPGRYRMHDLIREHARALADQDDPGNDRDQATARLLDYYQHTAAQAEDLLARQARPARAPAASTAPAAVRALADQEQALAWARAERVSLLACLDLVTGAGLHTRIIALTAAVASLLRYDGPWAEAIARHATAVRAARQAGDRLGQASALSNLGDLRRLADDYPGAARDLAEALGIFRDLGDRPGQAHALNYLGVVRRAIGDYPGAARDLAEALGIFRDLGDRPGQAHALSNLGDVRLLTGDYPGTGRYLAEALGLYRDLGNRLGQAHALRSLAGVRRRTGDYPGAARDLEEVLSISRDLGNRLGEANALNYLGIVRRLTGDYPGAARDLAEALGIYRDLGNRNGQANALRNMGVVRRLTGDCPAAARDLAEALSISRDLGDRLLQGSALSNLGVVRRLTGDYPAAARDLAEALAICRGIGTRDGLVEVLNEFGTLHRTGGDLVQARACHEEALDLARADGIAWDEAHALAGLGRCARAEGRAAEAEAQLRRALEILRRIGAAGAADLAAELDALPLLTLWKTLARSGPRSYVASTFGMISSFSRLRSSSVFETGTSANGGQMSSIVSPASFSRLRLSVTCAAVPTSRLLALPRGV